MGASRLVGSSIAVLVICCVGFGVFVLAMGFLHLNTLGHPDGGVRGDFFGGHFGPAIGSWTLAVVVWTSYIQQKRQQEFFAAQHKESKRVFYFNACLNGINLISQWDIKDPGCPQAMRLLDYYSRIAAEQNDDELFLLLNTIMTDQIRQELRDLNAQGIANETYVYARYAVKKISAIRATQAKPVGATQA